METTQIFTSNRLIVWYIHTLEYYRAMTENALLLPATTEINLMDWKLRKRRQTQEGMYVLYTFIYRKLETAKLIHQNSCSGWEV